eukprot:10156131-Heterocapsa_arctica.AAC.1
MNSTLWQSEQQTKYQASQILATQTEMVNRDWRRAAQTKLMAENLANLQSRLDLQLVAATRHPAKSIPIPVTASIGEAIDVSTPPPAVTVGGAS